MKLLKPRTILLGGLAIAAVAGAMKNRDKVAGLIGVRSSAPEPWTPTTPASPPPPADADLPSESAATSAPPMTTIPEPEPEAAEPVVDEAAEEAAAAQEAAAIGGATPTYSGIETDQPAPAEERAVLEGGGGEAEGGEQAQADLVSTVETPIGGPEARQSASHPMISDEPAEEPAEVPEAHAPDEAPEAETAAEPAAEAAGASGVEAAPEDSGISSAPSWGERFRARVRERDEARAREESGIQPGPEADAPDEPEADAPEEPKGEAAETSAEEKSGAVWRSDEPASEDAPSEEPLLAPDEQPTIEADSLKPDASGGDDDEGSEWQTWSGRAIEP